MKYKQQFEGDWVFPRRHGYYMKCCDCGLVHRMNFALVKHGRGKRIAFQAFRITQKNTGAEVCR